MNRYVAIPRSEVVPEDAIKLANLYSLEIRVDDQVSEAQIIALPENKKIEYSQVYVPGFIWSLDIIDEFVILSNKPLLMIAGDEVTPKIAEKHKLVFRKRLYCEEELPFSVYVDGAMYHSGVIVSNNESL